MIPAHKAGEPQQVREALGLSEGEHVCEACDGDGHIDMRLTGWCDDNPKSECPDCDGKGWWRTSATRSQP
jgi:DnaJ-class molecular chaperone